MKYIITGAAIAWALYMADKTGPKISVLAISILLLTSANTVGFT